SVWSEDDVEGCADMEQKDADCGNPPIRIENRVVAGCRGCHAVGAQKSSIHTSSATPTQGGSIVADVLTVAASIARGIRIIGPGWTSPLIVGRRADASAGPCERRSGYRVD